MTKILIILNSQYETGAYNAIMASCEALKNEFDFHFAFPKSSLIESDCKQRFQSVVTYEPAFISKNWRIISFRPRIRKSASRLADYMQENNITKIHVNDIYNLVGVEIKRRMPNVQLIQHVRLRRESYINKLYTYFVNKLSKSADQIIAVSDCVLSDMGEMKKASRVYDVLGLKEKDDKYTARPSTSSILYVGRLIPGKGQDLFIKALSKIEVIDFKVKIIGGLPEQSKYGLSLLNQIASYNLQDVVSFEDFSPNIEKSMKEADIVVNFSESESFSRVCAEALFYGVPLISSDCGGPSELMIHRESGILVPNRDVDQLARAIQELSHDFELREKISNNSRKVLEERIDDQLSTDQLRKLYNQA